GPHTWLTIEVAIVDSNGNPVSGADVTIDLEYPDGSINTYTATTGSDGVATFEFKKVPQGTYTVTVTDVTHTDYTYDATANVVTSKTFTI
ncbi:MAG: Ig-like domain-containing protein, partial [Promethearchaeati archaeon]